MMEHYYSHRFYFILFIGILLSLVAVKMWGIGDTGVKGFSFKNAALYGSFFIIIATNMLYKRSSFQNVFGYLPLTLLLLLAAISVIYSPNWHESLQSLKIELVDVIVIYIIGCNLFRSFIWAERALHVLAICFGFLNILAMTFFVTGVNPFASSVMFTDTRFASFAKVSNHGAYALEFFLPIFLYFFLTVRHKFLKIIYAVILITCIAGILLTGSRGGYVGFILQIFLFLILTRKLRGTKPIILFLMVTLLGVYLAMGELLVENLFRYQQYQGGSLETLSNGRTIVWNAMLQVITSNPINLIIGTGWGSYWSIIPDIADKTAAAHSIYLTIFLEVGLIGLSFLVAFIISFYRSFKKYITPQNSLFYYCSFCSLFILVWAASLSLLTQLLSVFALTVAVMNSYMVASSLGSDVESGSHSLESGNQFEI